MEEDKDENLVAHLEALRSMLIRCLTAIAVGLLPMFLIAPYFLDWLIKTIIADSPVTLNFFSPAEVFILQIKHMSPYIYFTEIIMYSFTPDGVCSFTSSSTLLPIKAFANGELTDKSFFLMSASSAPTIL